MSRRIDASWTVVRSIETPEGDRCVDLFMRPDGTFGFEAFRRDPEDLGGWTPVAYHSAATYETEAAALTAATNRCTWLASHVQN